MKTHLPLAHQSLAHQSLAREFEAATEADWHAMVATALKTVPFEKKLVVKTRDGINLPALSQRDATATLLLTKRGIAPWGIAARLDHPDAQEANRLALEELEGGADTLILSLSGSRGARGFGLPDCAPETLNRAFAGIHLDLVSLRLELGEKSGEQALALAHWLKSHGYVPASLRVDFGLPICDSSVIKVIPTLVSMGYSGPFLACDGRFVHEAGGSEAQELAFLLASAEQALRDQLLAGISPATARASLGFTLVADQDQVLTLAKFRAMRLLLARFDEICGVEPESANALCHLHAETAWRMQTKRDCQVTILRNVIAAFAAGVAGADSIAVLPHTAALGLPDGAARRLARNSSHILIEEAQLARMVDPASGSGTIEGATHALCEEAWRIFQSISQQRAGEKRGLAAAFENGFLAQIIAPVREARMRDIATRRSPLTGVSEFPNIQEAQGSVLLPREADAYASPLPLVRDSQAFEDLRDQADKSAQAGKVMRVFLANLGKISEFSARSTFVKNLFETGGIAAIGSDGYAQQGGTKMDALITDYLASGAHIACICGSDEGYKSEAQATIQALFQAGCRSIYVAGKPTAQEDDYQAAGLSGFIYMGMDVPAFLSRIALRVRTY